jgi:hypothetical protein
MEYHFEWAVYDVEGLILGHYRQSIYGKSLAEACEYFESHNHLGVDEDGNRLEITCVKGANHA